MAARCPTWPPRWPTTASQRSASAPPTTATPTSPSPRGGWFGDPARSGGGPGIDLGSHLLDLCWWLLGRPEPTAVSALTHARLGERAGVAPDRYRAPTPAAAPSAVEDLAVALVRFAGGASLVLEVSWSLLAVADELRIAVHGERGGAELEPRLRLVGEHDGQPVVTEPALTFPGFDADQALAAEVGNFVRACLGREAAVCPPARG